MRVLYDWNIVLSDKNPRIDKWSLVDNASGNRNRLRSGFIFRGEKKLVIIVCFYPCFHCELLQVVNCFNDLLNKGECERQDKSGLDSIKASYTRSGAVPDRTTTINNEMEKGFITILPFMTDELCLNGNELIVYAFLYGFSQEGKGEYFGGLQYLMKRSGGTELSTH